MQNVDARSVLDDFDPYVDEAERVELGESRVLVKDELYMPVHPSRDWIKCFVTSTQQDGFRMYLEGSGRRFLLSAKSFDVGKYYISAYEGYPNIDSKPKCGYVARVERQRDSSFLVCLDYCHLCDQKLGQFCCGRSRTEREVVAKISHSVKRYRKVNMEFRCITVTIPTISKSGTRKVWCPRSFRKVNPSLPNSADVHEALNCTPKMGMKLVSKLPEWNEDAKNLVVRFQGSGRILVASAKNFLLYEEKYSVLDFAEQSLSHIEEPPSKSTSASNSISGQKGTASNSINGDSKAKSTVASTATAASAQLQAQLERTVSIQTEVDEDDVEAMGGSMKSSPNSPAPPRVKPLVLPLKVDKLRSAEGTIPTGTSSEAGDEASKSSKASSRKSPRKSSERAEKGSKSPREAPRSKEKASKVGEGEAGAKVKRSSSRRKVTETDSLHSVSPKGSPRPASARSQGSQEGAAQKTTPRDAVERSVLQFGKSTSSRFVLDFKYPLSPLQAFGIAISAFASDEITDVHHEVNHMNSPVVVTRKQMDYARSRTASSSSLMASQPASPLKSPFPPSY